MLLGSPCSQTTPENLSGLRAPTIAKKDAGFNVKEKHNYAEHFKQNDVDGKKEVPLKYQNGHYKRDK